MAGRQQQPRDGEANAPVQPIRCLIADDHPALLEAVADYLDEAGFEIVARARSGREALIKIESFQPAIAVVDLRMPELNGIEVVRQAAHVSPTTAAILFTGQAEVGDLVEAVDAGARGFVLKEAPLADLLRAVETVAAGGTYVDPILAGTLASGRATGRIAELTTREREILRLLADGLKYDEIGKHLFISPETVRTHVRNAMKRLEAETRTQAVATALRQSLIA
jgi:DNA-binding NarL/FixJ family response regulator